MKNFKIIIGCEIAIALVLILIIALIPSHRKLYELKSESLTREHGASSIPMKDAVASADTTEPKENDQASSGDTTEVDANRPAGGMASYEDGNYENPTEGAESTPAASEGSESGEKTETESTPTPEPTKTETDDSAGNYIVAKDDAVMRTVPDSRDPMTAFDMIEAGDKLPILEKGVKSEDPEFKEWVKVEWNGYELYMKREDVDFVEE